MLIPLLAAALALQPSPAPPSAQEAPAAQPPVTSLDELPVEQGAAARCAIAFAVVSRWQKSNDTRGAAYGNMEEAGGREFFVQTMAKLMERTGMTREQILTLSFDEVNKLDNAEGEARIAAMMPPCLTIKQAAGL